MRIDVLRMWKARVVVGVVIGRGSSFDQSLNSDVGSAFSRVLRVLIKLFFQLERTSGGWVAFLRWQVAISIVLSQTCGRFFIRVNENWACGFVGTQQWWWWKV
jgi:hypothetical protein